MDRSNGEECEIRRANATSASERIRATIGGATALVFWSLLVGLAVSQRSSLGALTGPGLSMITGGVLGLAGAWMLGNPPWASLRRPGRYILGCGGLFVAYQVCLFLAIHTSPDDSTAIVVGLVNYLWPALTLALSGPILGNHVRWAMVVPGCLLAAAGTAVAIIGNGEFSLEKLQESGAAIALPISLAAVAALCWALYSNLVKRWDEGGAGAVPALLLVSGVFLWGMGRFDGKEIEWSLRASVELSILALFGSILPYVLWEWGMQRGRALRLKQASLLLPVASIWFAVGYLGLEMHTERVVGLAVGSVLVAAGAAICWKFVSPRGGSSKVRRP